MMMTNYMEILMSNEPWNLIAFMVLPVAMAELLTAAELFILARPSASAGWKRLSHGLGIAAGIYFACVVAFFLLHVLPNITLRGWIDALALIAYLLGIVPLGLITLQELGVFGGPSAKRQWHHILLLIGFLAVSHVAMIFGMVDPTLSGWQPPMQQNMMNMQHDMSNMPMDHSDMGSMSSDDMNQMHKDMHSSMHEGHMSQNGQQ
ncbi:DUF6803 family protein [uncultured Mitsuokella sp.]|uniref:DUF6803 family protein n=1 Tax=uncultured Mitsuokella sp. TaxID=453120 RepID=UPI0026701B74|nr:DUF6803 family protein [uncultured Mitsuokella sp.]